MANSGSGDIAHAYLVDIGPDISHEDVQHISYDDATAQLLVLKGGHVFAYDVSKGPVEGGSALKWMYPLQEGPPVRALRASLDNSMLAVQRSAAMLELVNLATGMCFVHSIHKGRGDILSFFWTDAPDTDMVIVTSRAVEINQFAAKRQGLRCRERVRGLNSWAIYTHETRMVIVGAAAAPHSSLSAWQFASHGTTRLPLFELQGPLPSSAAVRQFLPAVTPPPLPPPPAAAAAAAQQGPSTVASAADFLSAAAAGAAVAAGGHWQSSAAAAAGSGSTAAAAAVRVQQSHRDLNPSRLRLLKMYGRVYLAHIDTSNRRLELYRFYTDTILLQHVYELIASKVELSVADNTLVVHYPESSVVMLFDVALPQTSHLANPLPLRRLQLLPPPLAAAAAADLDDQQQQGLGSTAASSSSSSSGSLSRSGSRVLITAGSGTGSASNVSSAAAAAAAGTGGPGDVFESSDLQHSLSWEYYMPGLILDKANKTFSRLQLDLQAVTDSAEDWPALVGFLLRRHALPPTAPFAVDPRTLLMQVARGALQEKVSLSGLRQIFDKLLQAYADALARTAAAAPGLAAAAAATQPGSSRPPAAAAVTPIPAAAAAALLDVPCFNVLTPNEVARDLFQWVHDEEVVDAPYLQAAVSEYCAAADAVGVPPPAYIQLLAVDLLLQQEQHYQAVQLLYSQPNCGSAMLAQHLLEVAGKDSASGPGGVSSILAGFSGGPRSGLVTQGGNLGPRVQGLGGLDASPGSAMALELALDVTARQAVPELRPIGGKFGGLAGSSDNLAGGSNLAGQRNSNLAGQKVSTAAYVRQLLGLGQVLQAARIARTAGGVAAVQVPAREFLEVAAAAGDAGAFAAVYRVMRPQLVGTWPDFEAARSHFLDAATAQG